MAEPENKQAVVGESVLVKEEPIVVLEENAAMTHGTEEVVAAPEKKKRIQKGQTPAKKVPAKKSAGSAKIPAKKAPVKAKAKVKAPVKKVASKKATAKKPAVKAKTPSRQINTNIENSE